MKKVLLIYNDFNRETKETLNRVSEILVDALKWAGIQDSLQIDTCKMTSCKEKSKDYDFLAGYHIETDISLYLSQHFPADMFTSSTVITCLHWLTSQSAKKSVAAGRTRFLQFQLIRKLKHFSPQVQSTTIIILD